MDAIKLARLVEIAGRRDVEREAREAGRDADAHAHAHQVLCLCFFLSAVPEWVQIANIID